MKYFYCAILFFLTFFATSVDAATGPIVFVKENNSIIASEGADSQWALASISKLMTALVLQELKLDWNAPVILRRGDEVGGARLRVSVGSQYRRIDLLHASLMGSANNATYALARTSGLSMSEFVLRMNQRAHELGMSGTHFVEPTGLSPENISTARDIALMIEAAEQNLQISEIGRKLSYTLTSIGRRPQKHTIKTTNKLLLTGCHVMLGKTGFIYESGYNFAVMGQSPTGESRTVVVLNAVTMLDSFRIARQYVAQQN